MNSEDQQTLCNLRMLSKLQKDQWIITESDASDSSLNIIGMCDDTYYNNFSLAIRRDSFHATLECLKSIYCEKLPILVEKLIEEEEDDNLKHVQKQLIPSISGLKKIMELYNQSANKQMIQAHLESIENDFALSIKLKIENYLSSKD